MAGRTVTSVFPGRCWLSLSSDRSPSSSVSSGGYCLLGWQVLILDLIIVLFLCYFGHRFAAAFSITFFVVLLMLPIL